MSEVKLYKKNAKKHPDKQLKQIANSLREFGWRQPIVVDKDDVIIVGHGRWLAYKRYPDGIKEPWIIKADDLTDDQVKAYRLADNKLNESSWNLDLAVEDLKELSDQLFDLTGFDKKDLLGEEYNDPEIEFSDELLLEHNYVVLYFDNPLDWQVAVDKLGLKNVKTIAPDKSQKIGIGRVIKGKEVIDRL